MSITKPKVTALLKAAEEDELDQLMAANRDANSALLKAVENSQRLLDHLYGSLENTPYRLSVRSQMTENASAIRKARK